MLRPADSNVIAPTNGPMFRIPIMATNVGILAPGAGGGASASGGGGGGAAAQTAAGNETAEGYFGEFGANNPTTVGIVGAMTRCLAQAAVATTVTPTQIMCASLFKFGAAQAIIDITEPPAGAALTPDDEVRSLIQANMVSANTWMYNLIIAAKKKTLTSANVEGFFSSHGHTCTGAAAIAKWVNMVACAFPDEIHDASARDLMAEGSWKEYRITRCSTGAIIKQNIGFLYELGIVVQGDAVDLAIQAASDAPWNVALADQIPSVTKAYVCIYLEAAGTPIEKWYQGNKARDNLPSVRARGAKEIFRRYLEIKNSTDGLNAVTSVQDLTAVGGIAAKFF